MNAAKVRYGAKERNDVNKRYDIIAENEIISFIKATTINSKTKKIV